MHAIISPAILAATPKEYRRQVERVTPFARRIQIDLTDGDFATSKTVSLEEIGSLPHGIDCDLHLMYRHPEQYLAQVVALKPSLVIVHAETGIDFRLFAERMHEHGIRCGLAYLPGTNPEATADALTAMQHAMIFSGSLGQFGGVADLGLLATVARVQQLRPGIEIGWDGGVSIDNIRSLAEGGVTVLNSGGFIQNAADPEHAYRQLEAALGATAPDAVS